MKKIIIKKYNYDDYANGLLKSIEHTIAYCQNKIDESKHRECEPNTPEQIGSWAHQRAYINVISMLLNKRNRIIKKAKQKLNDN